MDIAIYIIISIVSLLVLVVLHELGHFLVAKRYNVKVEEFGIGIPPRIIGKKFGETVYSLNALPIGAFVKLYGEGQKIKDERSFSEKSIFQRALILLGGVVAFWVVAFILLTIIAGLGFSAVISDDIYSPDAQVVILGVEDGLPASEAGMMHGDILLKFSSGTEEVIIERVSDVRSFLADHRGNEIVALIKRGDSNEELNIISHEEEGIIGVSLARMETQKYPWYQAPFQGALMTGTITFNIVHFLGSSAKSLIFGEPLPPGAQIAGPVGIVDFFVSAIERGFVDYLQVMVMVSISLAVFNLLPIPALDGGRLLLLAIEKIKGSPINQKLEQNLIAGSFLMLLGLFLLVTFNDIWGL